MRVQQRVDWASPDMPWLAASVYRQMQRGILHGPLIALVLLTGGGVFWVVSYRNIFFLVAALLGLLRWWNAQRSLSYRLRIACNSGLTESRLEPDEGAMHIVNALGGFRLPLTKMGRVARYQGALSMNHGGNATIVIPDGPERTALER